MEAKGEMMKSVLRWCVVPLLATTLVAQTAAKPKPKKPVARRAAVTTADVQALKDALAAQQQQIVQLRQAMQSRDAPCNKRISKRNRLSSNYNRARPRRLRLNKRQAPPKVQLTSRKRMSPS